MISSNAPLPGQKKQLDSSNIYPDCFAVDQFGGSVFFECISYTRENDS